MRENHGLVLRRKVKVSFAKLVGSMVSQALSGHGTLGQHLRAVSGVNISDEAAMQRRASLSWEWFEALFGQVLRPRAKLKEHPESFYCGHRLLGVDGTAWSLRNTEAILSQQQRSRHRNGQKEAAFYKWGTAVLLELGTHQPLSVARALPKEDRTEGELNIARRTLGAIPNKEDTLLLADRLYGCGRFICDVQQAAGPRAQVLVRVSSLRQTTVLRALSDGSALVETGLYEPGANRPSGVLQVREIRGEVWRQNTTQDKQKLSDTSGHQKPEPERTEVRLWTTLLDEKAHPAEALLKLYAQRWEQELFFGELKSRTANHSLLRAASLQGAEAEFGALILAANLLAGERLKAAQSVGLAPVRLSIKKIGYALEALQPMLQAAEGIITEQQRQRIVAKFLVQMAREAVIKKRRSRSCQRGVRKPQCSWPRIHTRTVCEGPFAFKVIAS